MKKIFSLIITIMCVQFIYAKYDCTKNYQGKNVMNYLGEELYVIPYIDNNGNPIKGHEEIKAYMGFKSTLFSIADSEYDNMLFYHSDPFFKYFNVGTEPCWLAGKIFKVTNIQKMRYYEHSWVFDLESNSGERCKYVYNDGYNIIDGVIKYPFISVSYFKWLKKTYINNKVIIGTKFTSGGKDRVCFYHYLFDIDIKTKEKIQYNNSYEEYTVKDVVFNNEAMQLCLLLQNSKHTVYCPIAFMYEKNINKHYITRIFLKTEWDYLCEKYGKEHMIAIMQGNIINGMSVDEMHMSKGTESTKTKIDNETIIYTWPNRKGTQIPVKVKNGYAISVF